MGLSLYNIRKWIRMLTGHSEMHVHQTIGTHFLPGKIAGYFNNMTEKVLKEPELVQTDTLPMNHAEQGDVVFPVTIFQYALGCYDLYLQTKEDKYRNKFIQLADWAVDNQENNGAWNNFGFIYPDAPYGSMCQGEAASVLVRAYKETDNEVYLNAAKHALDFMLVPIDRGGTAIYKGEDLFLYEFTNKPLVLNGWIFSVIGIYDYNLANNGVFDDVLNRSMKTLEKYLSDFDNGYWSKYDIENIISSPFYHDLHISQLEALCKISGKHGFIEYHDRFLKYKSKRYNRIKAFLVKAFQKVLE